MYSPKNQTKIGFVRAKYVIAAIAALSLIASAATPSPVAVADLPAPTRHRIDGPAVMAEPDCTIWVPSPWEGRVGAAGALVLER